MRRSLPYQPALDGLRGIAVAMVLAFHLGYSWMSGGYVGVSVFFTLSGFLITSVLLNERDSTGSVAVGSFYAARLRRLLPASLLCLAGISVASRLGAFDEVTRLRRDLTGALLQVQNWVALSGDSSYTELLNETRGKLSPLEHYWSLAIEEQFYWLWPVVMLLICRRWAGRLRLYILATVAVVAAVAAPVVAGIWGADAVYWSTPSRIGEILIGGVLAAAVRYAPRVIGASGAWLGAAALLVIVWAAVAWPAGSGPAYHGWMPLFALASAVLILSLQQPSWLTRVLAVAPLRGLGVISYGVYLYHWPVFLLVDGAASRLGITLAMALASFHIVERPVRAARWKLRSTLSLALAGTFAVLVAGQVVAQDAVDPFAAGSTEQGQLEVVDSVSPLVQTTTTTVVPGTTPTTVPESTTTAVPVTSPAPLPELLRPVRVVIAGDSTGWRAGDGLIAWASANSDVAQVSMTAAAGCGFISSGTVVTDYTDTRDRQCREMLDPRLPELVERSLPDVVVLMQTFSDMDVRIWSDAEGPLDVTDPRFRERMLSDYLMLSDRLVALGVPRIAWVKTPITDLMWVGEEAGRGDPARYAVRNEVIDEVVRRVPQARIIDLQTWYTGSDFAADPASRPDGVHFPLDIATAIAEQFLGEAIVRAAVGV